MDSDEKNTLVDCMRAAELICKMKISIKQYIELYNEYSKYTFDTAIFKKHRKLSDEIYNSAKKYIDEMNIIESSAKEDLRANLNVFLAALAKFAEESQETSGSADDGQVVH